MIRFPNRWSAQWVEWEDYGKLWAQLVRGVMRQEGSETVAFSLVREGDDALIELRLLTEEGRFRDGLSPVVRVQSDAGDEQTLALRQAGPGVYRAKQDFGSAETITANLQVSGGVDRQTVERAGTRTIFSGFPDEYRSLPPNLDLLRTIAGETGGKMGSSPEEIFDTGDDIGQRATPLWPWLAIAALLFYLIDILLRRLPYAWRRLGS